MLSFQGPWEEFGAAVAEALAKEGITEQATFFITTARDAALHTLEGTANSQIVRVSGMWHEEFGFHLSIQKV